MLKSLISFAAALALAAPLASAQRPAPPLQFVAANGAPVSLAALKGKVVIIEFLLTTCPGCQESARLLSKLQTEMGPQGLQVIGVAMDPEAPINMRDFVSRYATAFPVGMYGYTESRKWLQIPEHLRLMVPAIVVVDRAGMIREQHLGDDRPWVDNKETNLRATLKTLLAQKGSPAKKSAAPKK
jgi:peroxiredoxin